MGDVARSSFFFLKKEIKIVLFLFTFSRQKVVQKLEYTNTTDVWSLGITVIEMADAAAPYAGNPPMQVIKWIPEREPPTVQRPQDFSDNFNEFVRDCLSKKTMKIIE